MIKYNKVFSIFSIIQHKINKVLSLQKNDIFYHVSSNSVWQETNVMNFCDSFFAAELVLLYYITGISEYKLEARRIIHNIITKNKDYGLDMGFIWYFGGVLFDSAAKTDEFYELSFINAAKLAQFYDKKLGFFKDIWNNISPSKYLTAIDILMNLGLIWWAYKYTKDYNLYKIAYSHVKNTILYLIKEDGGVYQLIEVESKAPLTYQGLSSSSCWSRGLAWAIYGLTMAHRLVKEDPIKHSLYKLISYYIENTDYDLVPRYDFYDKEGIKDSSAAAISASAMLNLDIPEAKDYSYKIINSLIDNYFLYEEKYVGFLHSACFDKRHDLYTSCSLTLADFFFLEAICKILYNVSSFDLIFSL